MHVRYRGAGRWRRSLPIVVAFACALGSAGVVSRPAVELERARARSAALERRARDVDRRRDELECFEAEDGFEQLEDAVARLDALFPHEPSPVEQHAALRLLAQELGIELEALHFSEERDAGIEALDDRILMRGVRVEGRAQAGAVVDFVAALGTLGMPGIVLEAHLERADAASTDFGFLLRLGLLHTTDTVQSIDAGPAEAEDVRR
jgi:hypothetical protein